MELRQSTSLRQTLTLGPQFYLEQKLLQMPVLELLDELRKELSENPALELEEVALCPTCNKPLNGTRCENCGKSSDPGAEDDDLFIRQQIMDYDEDQSPYEGPSGSRGEREPAMAVFLAGISPANRAQQITKPLLVVQGLNDPRVPASESEQMVKAIRDRGGKVWFLMAKDEGHGFQKKRNVDFLFLSTATFLRENLLNP